jgi:glycosyltransferase involved in cell wall biosynthesis
MFRRAVDYCSGAFLLTRRTLFEELNGFDEDYAPAYYEETDYCLRLERCGKRVVYDPRVVILHYEFASSETSHKAIELQIKNRHIFVNKHRHSLSLRLDPDIKNILIARHAGRSKPHILVIDDRVPHRYIGSGFPRANSILNALVRLGYLVTFYPLQFPKEDWETIYTDIPLEVEVMIGYGLDGLGRFFENRPRYYDVIFLSRPHNMSVFRDIFMSNNNYFYDADIIYDAEAIFAKRDIMKKKLGAKAVSESEIKNLIGKEVELANIADRVITVSEQEKMEFIKQGYKNVFILGHSIDLSISQREFAFRKHFLFVGNLDYLESPNVDSVFWFVQEIFPEIRHNIGEVKLVIAGSNKCEEIKKLQSDHVTILGRVEDLSRLYDECRVFIAPTRYAGGIPHKIQEAAANGLPAVATSLVANQLGWKIGNDILAADVNDPKMFAEMCIRLYKDKETWIKVRESSLKRIMKECSSEVFLENLRLALPGSVTRYRQQA